MKQEKMTEITVDELVKYIIVDEATRVAFLAGYATGAGSIARSMGCATLCNLIADITETGSAQERRACALGYLTAGCTSYQQEDDEQ